MPPARGAHRHADRDAGQPGREQRVAAEIRERSKRLDEGRLHQVLDVRARSDHPAHDPVHGADMGLKQIAERGRIAAPRAVDERGDLRGWRT